jgi:3-oxo-5-alpha-steroid 4-dehydrogenase 1
LVADTRLEWTGFAIAAAPAVLVAVPPLASLQLSGWLASVSSLVPAWPRVLLAAPWAFVLAEVTSMLPRALRGHAWYQRTFDYPPARRAAIPWLL